MKPCTDSDEIKYVGELVSNGAGILYYRPYNRNYLMSDEEMRRLAPCVAEDKYMVLLAAETYCSP